VDDEPIGAALVLRCDHLPGWRGPWLMNTFRAPEPAVRGIGAAMVIHAIRALRDAGETYFGLAVTDANPARRVYERLGFRYRIEGWNVLMPS
jgi:GNAT superfamily N-acetyltransferase